MRALDEERWGEVILTVNIFRLVTVNGTHGKLSVRRLSSAITARKIVDDQAEDLVARDTLKSGLNTANVLNGVAMKGKQVSACI